MYVEALVAKNACLTVDVADTRFRGDNAFEARARAGDCNRFDSQVIFRPRNIFGGLELEAVCDSPQRHRRRLESAQRVERLQTLCAYSVTLCVSVVKFFLLGTFPKGI